MGWLPHGRKIQAPRSKLQRISKLQSPKLQEVQITGEDFGVGPCGFCGGTTHFLLRPASRYVSFSNRLVSGDWIFSGSWCLDLGSSGLRTLVPPWQDGRISRVTTHHRPVRLPPGCDARSEEHTS